MEDIVPKTPDLKDIISTDEASRLEGYSIEEIEDLKEHGEMPPPEAEEHRLLDRKEAESLKKETDALQQDVDPNS